MALLVIAMNIAVVAFLVGVAHFFAWAGPGVALGFIAGMFTFASWMRITDGKWP